MFVLSKKSGQLSIRGHEKTRGSAKQFSWLGDIEESGLSGLDVVTTKKKEKTLSLGPPTLNISLLSKMKIRLMIEKSTTHS